MIIVFLYSCMNIPVFLYSCIPVFLYSCILYTGGLALGQGLLLWLEWRVRSTGCIVTETQTATWGGALDMKADMLPGGGRKSRTPTPLAWRLIIVA